MQNVVGDGKLTKIQVMLSLLPIPPIPIRFCLDMSGLQNADAKQALGIAMSALEGEAKNINIVQNSHSIIAALYLFSEWSELGKNYMKTSKLKKDGLVLELMGKTLSVGDDSDNCHVEEDTAYDLFFDITKNWISSYIPEDANISMTMEKADLKAIEPETKIHMAISHYSYAQGVVYSSKTSLLRCNVHEQLCQTYRDMCEVAKQTPDSIEARELDNDEVRKASQEISELYSKHVYGKLLTLAFTRIHRDSRNGHLQDPNQENVKGTAEKLIQDAQILHKKVMQEHGISEQKNMALVASEPYNSVVVASPVIEEIDDDKKKNAIQQTVHMFLIVLFKCLSDANDKPAWNSLLQNFENLETLVKCGHPTTLRACAVVNIRVLVKFVQPFVEDSMEPDPTKKRIHESILNLNSLDFGLSDMPEEHIDQPPLDSLRSELGILIRNVAMDIEENFEAVKVEAHDIYINSKIELMQQITEVFYSSLAVSQKVMPDKIEVLEDYISTDGST